MKKIESAENKKIKLAASLHKRHGRDKENLFAVEGMRLAETAVDAHWPIRFGLCTPQAAQKERVQSILETLEKRGCPVFSVDARLYQKASATVTPQGLLLVAEQKTAALDRMADGKTALIAVLDGVQDPGNAGTIIRTADAAGCTGIVLLGGSADPFSDKTVRATMGSLFHIPVAVEKSLGAFREFCHRHGIRLLATAANIAAEPYDHADYTKPTAILFGNEGNGISAEALETSDQSIHIPMFGQAESLNVAAASAIILYEAARQRHGKNNDIGGDSQKA